MAHIGNFGAHTFGGQGTPFPPNTTGTVSSQAVVITDTANEGEREFFTIEYIVDGQVIQTKNTSVPYPGDSVILQGTITTPSGGSNMDICARIV